MIHGFAQGGFGRDHYDCVKIEAVGTDWIVARAADGGVAFAAGEHSLKHLIRVRDEDADKCPSEDGCPVENLPSRLTVPGGW